MPGISSLAQSIGPSAFGPEPAASGPLVEKLREIAERGRIAASAALCMIAWQVDGAGRLVRAPSYDHRNEALASAALASLAGELPAAGDQPSAAFRLTIPHPAAREPAPPMELRAFARAERSCAATVIVVGAARSGAQVDAILEVLTGAALALIADSESATSRDFWKQRFEEAADELARLRHQSGQARAELRGIERALTIVAHLKPGEMAREIGKIAATAAPFDAWIVAIRENGEDVRFAAASTPELVGQSSEEPSALVRCIETAAAIVRADASASEGVYREDRAFAQSGCTHYVCVPFETGAVALASRAPIDPDTVEQVRMLMACLGPAIRARSLEREAKRRRALVQNLALRLYDAIDAERARIARDLHDDLAQIVVATQIALTGKRGKARRIVREIQREVRNRIRTLRPVTLGRASLREAIATELQRLGEAGIEGRIATFRAAAQLARPIQNVCYLVVREALANVVRHARARHVEVSLERAGGSVRLSIVDDGRGIGARVKRDGPGLRGLAERVELLGGRVRLETRRGRTQVIAEIPISGK
jgi:signal transduction histidine kinase